MVLEPRKHEARGYEVRESVGLRGPGSDRTMRTLIKNGTVVTAVDQYKGDVLVEDEKIAVIGTTLDMPASTR